MTRDEFENGGVREFVRGLLRDHLRIRVESREDDVLQIVLYLDSEEIDRATL